MILSVYAVVVQWQSIQVFVLTEFTSSHECMCLLILWLQQQCLAAFKFPWNTPLTHTSCTSCTIAPWHPPPWSWKADPDDALSEWAAWGNRILSVLTRGTAEDSWAHIKLSLCSHVKINDHTSYERSLFSSVSTTTLKQNQFILKIVVASSPCIDAIKRPLKSPKHFFFDSRHCRKIQPRE